MKSINKITSMIVIVTVIFNAYLTFVLGGANILLLGNWLLPFVLLTAYLFLSNKVDKSQSVIDDSKDRLDIIRKIIDNEK